MKYQKKVERGMKWLDENAPADWIWRINLSNLNMSSHKRCILGQLFGEYAVATIRYFGSYTRNLVFNYGFNAKAPVDGDIPDRLWFREMCYLGNAWKKAIEDRRESDNSGQNCVLEELVNV
jgi:hypothetical protein